MSNTCVVHVHVHSCLLCLQSQQPTLKRGSFEELSILFSVKDLLLPQLLDTTAISTFVLLLSDLFPGCDMAELLAHERQLQEGLAEKAVENREAGTSARESRAASAMMVVRDESRHPSEGLWVNCSSSTCTCTCACLYANHTYIVRIYMYIVHVYICTSHCAINMQFTFCVHVHVCTCTHHIYQVGTGTCTIQ